MGPSSHAAAPLDQQRSRHSRWNGIDASDPRPRRQSARPRQSWIDRRPAPSVIHVTAPMNVAAQSSLSKSGEVLLRQKGLTNMTKTEIKNEFLTDAELDGVVGGLDP